MAGHAHLQLQDVGGVFFEFVPEEVGDLGLIVRIVPQELVLNIRTIVWGVELKPCSWPSIQCFSGCLSTQCTFEFGIDQ